MNDVVAASQLLKFHLHRIFMPIVTSLCWKSSLLLLCKPLEAQHLSLA